MDKTTEEIRNHVIEHTDMSREIQEEELFERIDEAIDWQASMRPLSVASRDRYRTEVFNSMRRLDILQELIDDEDISEIMVNGTKDIFIEKNGRISRFEKCFESSEKLFDIACQMAARANRIVNESVPIVDTRLKNGSRVNIVLPPVALNGPVITIRKFRSVPITMEKLVEMGAVSAQAAEFLKQVSAAGYNIFISGGTGSGKTTFLNALSEYIPRDERVITIEDSAELQLQHVENLVSLETRNANMEGENAITIRDLIKASLRMRPDRIIVGEVRGSEAIDMLQGMNTGHKSLSTGHANSPADMLSRLETMVLMGMDIPLAAVRGQIASAIDIVVHLGRMRDKSRKVVSISEVTGYKNSGYILNTLFELDMKTGVLEEVGELKSTAKLERNEACR
jgi:pilus assembly protein CpaF